MNETELLKVIASTLGGSSLVVVAVLLYLFSHPDKFDKWGSLFYKVLHGSLGRLGALRDRIDRGRVAYDIQAAVNGAGEVLSRQSPGVLPYSLKIEWVKSFDIDSFVRGGEVVVRLERHFNQEKNLVAVAQAYVAKAFLPRARGYLDYALREASYLTVIRQILVQSGRDTAYEYFHDSLLGPAMRRDPRIRGDCSLLDTLDAVGLLNRLFFYEIRKYGDRVYPTIASEREAQELRAFANFLYVIAAKASGEDVPLQFTGPRLKVAIILIARSEKIRTQGLGPYTSRIARSVRSGFDSLFLCGWGSEHRTAVREIARRVERGGVIEIVQTQEFPISRHRELVGKGILVIARPAAAFRHTQLEAEKPVRNALARHVPEVAAGRVEIVEVAREPNVGSKVAVRLPEDHYGAQRAVRYCIGEGGTRHLAAKEELPRGEWLAIIPWSPDLKEFLLAALTPLEKGEVVDVVLEEPNLTARIIVADGQSAARALGKEGWNVRLAERLTGWGLEIVTQDAAKRIN